MDMYMYMYLTCSKYTHYFADVCIVSNCQQYVWLVQRKYCHVNIFQLIYYSQYHTCSAVFLSNKLLVVVAELYGDENEALDIVPVITTTLLEEHQIVTGIIVVVDPGVIPINSRGEKQRISLRDSFLADEMDPIYVAYNL